ncbi:MAG: DUF1572 family protein [Bacteroidetes bacterium]|nr:DUF1572 family protein [Bacteroidota bacterium]
MSAFAKDIQQLLVRDLKKLETEISQYADEQSIWKVDKLIANSAGNLCLHLCGNLQHYIGAILGKSGYVRNRDNEFAARGIARAALLEEIRRAIAAVEQTMPLLKDATLDAIYPQEVLGYPMTTRFFLIHLSSHLGYHLGQVNYHRRLLG